MSYLSLLWRSRAEFACSAGASVTSRQVRCYRRLIRVVNRYVKAWYPRPKDFLLSSVDCQRLASFIQNRTKPGSPVRELFKALLVCWRSRTMAIFLSRWLFAKALTYLLGTSVFLHNLNGILLLQSHSICFLIWFSRRDRKACTFTLCIRRVWRYTTQALLSHLQIFVPVLHMFDLRQRKIC